MVWVRMVWVRLVTLYGGNNWNWIGVDAEICWLGETEFCLTILTKTQQNVRIDKLPQFLLNLVVLPLIVNVDHITHHENMSRWREHIQVIVVLLHG